MTPTVPQTGKVPVLRCDFGDDTAWAQTWAAIEQAEQDGFQNNLEKVESRDFDGLGTQESLRMVRQLSEDYPHPVVYFADHATMSGPEHTLLVAWAWKDEYEGQFFRCLPSDVLAIENNVVDNMPWEEFRDAVGEDGVCRIE